MRIRNAIMSGIMVMAAMCATADPVVTDDDGSVVERRFVKEDVADQVRRDLRVEFDPRLDHVLERIAALKDDQRPGFQAGKIDRRLADRVDRLVVDDLTALLVPDDPIFQPAEGIGSHPTEHFADLGGENDDQRDHPGREDGAEHRFHGEKIQDRTDPVRRRPDSDADQISRHAPLPQKDENKEENRGKINDIENIEETDMREAGRDIT